MRVISLGTTLWGLRILLKTCFSATVALWAGGPVYLCSSAAVASLPAQAGSSVVYTAAGFEGPTASLPAKQGNITKSNKLKQQEVSRTACPKSHRGLQLLQIYTPTNCSTAGSWTVCRCINL